MRFARHLQEAGDAFRREELDSEDVRDRTVVDTDWRDMRVGFFFVASINAANSKFVFHTFYVVTLRRGRTRPREQLLLQDYKA